MTTLTSGQLQFLEECKLEFSDRFSDADLEYKKIYDLGIPPPPIMYPWFSRARFNHRDDRDRPGGSRFGNDRRYRDQDRTRSDDNFRGRDVDGMESRKRFRPY